MKIGPLILFLTVSNLLLCFNIRDYEPKQITTGPSNESSIVIDGKNTIYFASDRSGSYEIYRSDLDDQVIRRMTFHPGNHFPSSMNGNDIVLISDETDVNGNIHTLSRRGRQKLIYSGAGAKKNPFIKNRYIYFCSGSNGIYSFMKSDLKNPDKGKIILENTGGKAVFGHGEEIIYMSAADSEGYNNLYSYVPGRAEPVLQLTFGRRIVTGFDISADGSVIVFSAVTSDTNNDSRTDLFDNSVLFRIDREGDYWTDPVQMTSDSYSSFDPAISRDGRVFFLSDRRGSTDIWSCGLEGVAPLKNSFAEQFHVSEVIYEMYKAGKALSGLTGDDISPETWELLSTALISYNRTLSLPGAADEEMAESYFRIAEIHLEYNNEGAAESIYRIISARFSNREKTAGTAELRRLTVELIRRNISESEYSYELDRHIRYLITLSERYEDVDLRNLYYIRIGDIYKSLGETDIANNYYMMASVNSDGSKNTESLHGMAKAAFSEGNFKIASGLLTEAVNLTDSNDLKEKYVKEYFYHADVRHGNELLVSTVKDDKLPNEIKSYAFYLLGKDENDPALKSEYFGEVKKYFVSDPENIILKRISAGADLAYAEYFIENDMIAEAEGVLKYMSDNYGGLDYDIFTQLSQLKLSEIYLNRAAHFQSRRMSDNALLEFFKAYELDVSNIEALRGISDSYLGLKRINEAVRFFSEEQRKDPNSAFLNYALGYAFVLRATASSSPVRSDLISAERFLQRSIELDGNIKHAFLTLSYCYEGLFYIARREHAAEMEKNIFLKAVDFVIGPLKFILETVNIIDDKTTDYNDEAIAVLNRGLSIVNHERDRDLFLKMTLNLANSYYNMGEYAREQALRHYMYVIDNDYRFSGLRQKAITYERIGHCLFTINDMSASFYYEKAGDIYSELNDRRSSLRVLMRIALSYLASTDDEGEFIGGFDAYDKYSDIVIRLRSEDDQSTVDLVKRNSAFARYLDEEYEEASKIIYDLLKSGEFKDLTDPGEYIILNLLGIDIPVWRFDLTIGSRYSEGFRGKDELAFLQALKSSCYRSLKDFEKAKSALEAKADVFRIKKDNVALSIVENRIGVAEYFSNNFENASKRFRRSKDLNIKSGFLNTALVNENNILKSALRSFRKDRTGEYFDLIGDTLLFSDAYEMTDPLTRSENLNLKGVLAYRCYQALSYSEEPSDRYIAIKYLDLSGSLFKRSIDQAKLQVRGGETQNRMTAAAIFNLSKSLESAGYIKEAHEKLRSGLELAEQTYDKLLQWRYLLRSGDIETDADRKLLLYIESEKILSQYLPSTYDYELLSGWKDDIRPLYDRIVRLKIDKGRIEQAMNYAERYKNRVLLNYYSSRELDYKEQLHRIHIRKIRFNNEEISRYRIRAEVLRSRDEERFADRIDQYIQAADFYEEELQDVFDQIRRSGDRRLLQFVSVEDTDLKGIVNILGGHQSVISVYTLGSSTIVFHADDSGISYYEADNSDLNDTLSDIGRKISEQDNVFFIPEIDRVRSLNQWDYNFLGEKGWEYFTIIPTISSLWTLNENRNINYSDAKRGSSAVFAKKDLPGHLESGGIVYFDKPVRTDPLNTLEYVFTFGGVELKLKDFLALKMPAYVVIINGFDSDVSSLDLAVISNTLFFSGAQAVVVPASPGYDMDDVFELIKENVHSEDLTTILSEKAGDVRIAGFPGMDDYSQSSFARANLRNSLVNGIRFFNTGIYERSSAFFLQALAMARNIEDPQEINILKTLITSFSRTTDYSRAIRYGKELIVLAEKNGLDRELILAYDVVSKDYFRKGEFSKAIEYQEKIINDGRSEAKEITSAYEMLSIIYSQKGKYNESISSMKKYLQSSGILTDNRIDSFSEELAGNLQDILFNSMRGIMTGYYMKGDTDSALFVFETILENEELFDRISSEQFGLLFEAAGLCYFRISSFSSAEQLYTEALELISDKSKRSSVYLNLSDVYYFTDRLTEAFKYLSLAADSPDLSGPERIRLFTTRSLTELKKGDLAAAENYSFRALDTTIETENRSEESTARVNLARLQIMRGETDNALRNLSLGSQIAKETSNSKALTASWYYRGMIHLDHFSKPDSALAAFNKCLEMAMSDGDELFISRSYYGIGRSYIAVNDRKSAVEYLVRSVENSERYSFNDEYFAAAFKLAGLNYDLKNREKVLEVLEGLLARAVEINISNENAFTADQLEYFLNGTLKLSDVYLQSGNYDRAITVMAIRDEILFYNDLKYFDFNYIDKFLPQPDRLITVESISKNLPERSAAVFFIPNDKKCNVLLIKDQAVQSFDFRITDIMLQLSSRIERQGDFIQPARRMYEALFTSRFRSALEGIEDIYIYSSGSMKNFPFDALYDGSGFIIDKYNIAEITDLTKFLKSHKITGLPESISFINPFTAESDLVFAEREYRSLEFFSQDSHPVYGRNATETLLGSSEISRYEMLHLPVHSFILSRDSLITTGRSSYIQLSADEKNDGRLHWNEIISLTHSFQKVIISGCDTGGKSGFDYYDHFDLSRAFYASGSDIIISSRWKTDDLSASVLMKRYFRYISSGMSNIQAMAKAKQDVRQYHNSHPYYWANFKLSLR